MRTDSTFDSIYDEYFRKTNLHDEDRQVDDELEIINRENAEYLSAKGNPNNKQILTPKSNLDGYTYKNNVTKQPTESTSDIPGSKNTRTIAEDNIDDIDELAEHIRVVLNAAWGKDWGEFGPEIKEGPDPEDIKLPQITYDVMTRVIPDKKPLKPTLMDTVIETVNNTPTGDSFHIFRQWFDNVIEFNICGTNSLEARRLMKRFETILATYAGHLKKVGVSELLFLKEVHATQSANYREDIPMKCLMYLVRTERITVIRASTLRSMELALNTPNTAGQNSASKTYKI